MTTRKNPPLWQQLGDLATPKLPQFNGQPVPLGGMSAQTFIKEYWQKKPLLIRQAIPNFQAFFTPEDAIAALQDENFESRLVVDDATKGWSLHNGPLPKKSIPPRKQNKWTALIQGVDLHDPLGHALINLFRFIPDVRLDDLMISFATDGGGVGPHFDAYDVFLLQGYGKRLWRISQEEDKSIKPDLPVRILQNFTPTHEWELEAGDMLYLPPGWAHDGIAIGDCMTYSIGFRTPSFQELGVALLQFIEDNLALEGHYADPDLKFQSTPAQIPSAMINTVYQRLQQMRWDKDWVTESLGCYLSEPKPTTFFDEIEECTLAQFKKMALKNGLQLSFATKMFYREPWVFINGEHFVADGEEACLLQDFANARVMSADVLKTIDRKSVLWAALHDWYTQGWLIRADL